MIRAKTVTCSLCQSYYSDPRQIPCSHSFCFDCICGRFNEETLTLVCPDCQKTHRYTSSEEFHNRCMRNGVLAAMVAQFKKNLSRATSTSSASSPRPPSTLPHMSPTFASTPIPTPFSSHSSLTLNNGCHPDQIFSERSSPATFQPARPSPITVAPTNSAQFHAKCQLCQTKAELTVCRHCDSVMCGKCINDHLNKPNEDVQRAWQLCKAKFEEINEKSVLFDATQEKMTTYARNLQKWIREKADEIIESIRNQEKNQLALMEKHRKDPKLANAQEAMIDEYESIDKRIAELLRSNETSAEKINCFLFEIENLEGRIEDLSASLRVQERKFPVWSATQTVDLSSLLGSLDFLSSNEHMDGTNPYTRPLLTTKSTANPPTDDRFKNHTSYDVETDEEDDDIDDQQAMYRHTMNNHLNKEHFPSTVESSSSPSPSSSIPTVLKKKIIWQIDYFSVPYYVRTYGNQLFICDKYGSLAIYKFKGNDMRQKPTIAREMKLFPSTTSSSPDEDQTIIDSFVVYKLWIIVFKRKKNELTGTIFLFTHDGKPVPNGKCPHNYPSRELTIDTETNILWSLDQKQLTLFYYDLPENRVNNPQDYFQNRQSHVQLTKPFAPIHISVNKRVLAVLDKNRQAVHVFDKKTKQQMYEYVNTHNSSTHCCWDMALFADDSLLIKLDETSTLKAGPSKHIYLQLDNTPQHNVIGLIEETDAYGMMITPNDEILIGVRISTKGIVKCYA